MSGPGEWSTLKRWAHREKFMLRKGVKGEETHLMLDGGRLSIPDSASAEFLKQYARTLSEGSFVYLVEMKTTPVFNMMAEFDVKIVDRELTDAEVDTIARTIQCSVMAVAFPGYDATVAVSTPVGKKTATLDDGTLVAQSGVHLNWQIPVDIQTAWILRGWMLREIEASMANTKIATRWGEAFDTAIFERNGLRMIGSRKAERCPTCSKKEFTRAGGEPEWGALCAGCGGSRYIDLGRPYNIRYLMSVTGDMRPAPTMDGFDAIAAAVRFTTIRAISADGVRAKVPADVRYPSENIRLMVSGYVRQDKKDAKELKKKQPKKKTDQVAVGDADLAAKRKAERRDSLTELEPGSPLYDEIARYIMAEFDGAPIATHIKKAGSGDLYIINSKSHFCGNKGDEHLHSTVYFIMKPTGCVQRCFCPKDVIQPVGRVQCARYVSKEHKIPAALMEAAFSRDVRRVRQHEESRLKLAGNVLGGAYRGEAIPPARVSRQTYEYKAARDRVNRRYTPTDFLEAIKHADYKILR